MKALQYFFMVLLMSASMLFGADFGWMSELNTRYGSNQTKLHSGLNERFNVGDAVISSVVKSVAKPADAYMILKLAEMSGLSSGDVLKRYEKDKGKGWGALAQSLGIKPGSPEFKALKAGHDMDAVSKKNAKDKKDAREKSNEKSKAKKDKADDFSEKGKGKGKNQ